VVNKQSYLGKQKWKVLLRSSHNTLRCYNLSSSSTQQSVGTSDDGGHVITTTRQPVRSSLPQHLLTETAADDARQRHGAHQPTRWKAASTSSARREAATWFPDQLSERRRCSRLAVHEILMMKTSCWTRPGPINRCRCQAFRVCLLNLISKLIQTSTQNHAKHSCRRRNDSGQASQLTFNLQLWRLRLGRSYHWAESNDCVPEAGIRNPRFCELNLARPKNFFTSIITRLAQKNAKVLRAL